jgi:hypothetical protein
MSVYTGIALPPPQAAARTLSRRRWPAIAELVEGTLAEFSAVLDKFRTRPARDLEVALDELRNGLNILLNCFYDYEIPADRLAGEVPRGMIDEIRTLIRAQRKTTDDLLWDLPHRARGRKP